ncbi:MAG: hypothetical protein GY804_10930 [Alphaproteobacteria bacterium]|nr:hypothetical protein [Alphaproteobacteria bacterium]
MSNYTKGFDGKGVISSAQVNAGCRILFGEDDRIVGAKRFGVAEVKKPSRNELVSALNIVGGEKRTVVGGAIAIKSGKKSKNNAQKRAAQLSKRTGESVVVSNGFGEAEQIVIHVAAPGKGKNKIRSSVELMDLETGKKIDHYSEAGINALGQAKGKFPEPEKRFGNVAGKEAFDRNKVVAAALKTAKRKVSGR